MNDNGPLVHMNIERRKREDNVLNGTCLLYTSHRNRYEELLHGLTRMVK